MESPRSYYRNKHPDEFSDSTQEQVSDVDRSLLEFHLHTLTSRSQEDDFERFARRLCEREVCPNLVPSTGPFGGGDSKVDSETYPVADALALIWYSGPARAAGTERWAFAFSAKVAWPAKVKSDIKKIADTQRDYKKAFFVTNQAVPAKKRAALEDELSKEHGLDVRILDRTWIVERLFAGQHQQLAIDELGLTGISLSQARTGPSDLARSRRLEELESRIREATTLGEAGTGLVADALDAAQEMRCLEKSRPDVEGCFRRADTLALQAGSFRQQVESAYQWAWTLFWWYEDVAAFLDQYEVVERRVAGTDNVFDLERLGNLHMLLGGAARRDLLPVERLAKHTDFLQSELRRLKDDPGRPGSALQAESLLLQVELLQRVMKGQPFEEVIEGFNNVALRAEGLVSFPFEPLVRWLTEIGEILEDAPGYDGLFETIVGVASRRDGEVRAARLLLARGEKLIKMDRTLAAIATIGQALGRLYKDETRGDMVRALYTCGCAYQQLGLLWAARGTFLSAASVAVNEFWKYGELSSKQAACYRRLKWVELLLGRLPHTLAWQEVDISITQQLRERGVTLPKQEDSDGHFNTILARELIRTQPADVEALSHLPDVLDYLQLFPAADIVLFLLGYPERLQDAAEELGLSSAEELASRCWQIEADFPIPVRANLYNATSTILSSNVLGCQVSVDCSLEQPCVDVGESILAALESLLATSAIERAFPREPEFVIDVRVCESTKGFLVFEEGERNGRPCLHIRCRSFNPNSMSAQDVGEVRQQVFDVALEVLTLLVRFKDLERDLDALFGNERAADRAIGFACGFGSASNVLGARPRTRLEAWKWPDAKAYGSLRAEPWKPKPSEQSNVELATEPLTPGEDLDAPPGLFDPNVVPHHQMKTISLIRESLFARANWKGVAFFLARDNEIPPLLCLIFEDEVAGREIFKHWLDELGRVDEADLLRVAIVRGVSRKREAAYRVVLGANLEALKSEARLLAVIQKICQMHPSDARNLQNFLDAYEEHSKFVLAPAFMKEGGPVPDTSLRICKSVLHVRQGWEIGANDTDSVAIQDIDDVPIPDGIEDPPIEKLRQRRLNTPQHR